VSQKTSSIFHLDIVDNCYVSDKDVRKSLILFSLSNYLEEASFSKKKKKEEKKKDIVVYCLLAK
jgi:hypothetical protein